MIHQNLSTLRKLMLLKGATGGSKAIEATATGNPLTFVTDLARPLKSLLIPFTPVQSGTGDPSPENIRPLVPWNGLKVFGGGKNLLNPDGIVHNSYNIGGFVNTLKPNTKYTISINGTTNEAYRLYMTTESAPLSGATPVSKGYIFAGQKETFTTPSEMTGILVLAGNSAGEGNVAIGDILPMIEAGETATAYEPYEPITETDISFPSPVYGGTLDVVSGVLTVNWVVKVYDGSQDELWDKISGGSASAFAMQIQISGKSTSVDSYMCDSLKNIARTATWGNYDNWISDNQNSIVTGIKAITTVTDWRAYLAEHPITVAYKLATPQEIQLTPAQITALLGENTIWSDADGSMTAVYLKKG